MTPYVLPSSTVPFPKNLSLKQFIQTVIVGISGISGNLVRPKWQPESPKQPDINVNWIAYGIELATPDANSYVGVNAEGVTISQRHEELEVSLHIYGPDCGGLYGLLRDGFQIEVNRFGLFNANMGFTTIGPAQHSPDFVNERWIDRIITSIFLRREIQRTYPVLTLVSASGTVFAPLSGKDDYSLNWLVEDDD